MFTQKLTVDKSRLNFVLASQTIYTRVPNLGVAKQFSWPREDMEIIKKDSPLII